MLDIYEDIFETAKHSPLWWYNKSSDLHASAGALWLSIENEGDYKYAMKLGLGKTFSLEVACWPVYQMLFGMAFELIFKAIIVAMKKQPKHSHDLGSLANETGIEFSTEELSTLKMLAEVIVWGGRYPVPKNKQDLEKYYGLARNEGISLSWEDLDRIWEKGCQKFSSTYNS